MAYQFRRYGTFTGRGTDVEYRDNDDFSNIFEDSYFYLTDVGMALVNTSSSPADYVHFHLNGTNTNSIILERSFGTIGTWYVDVAKTTFNGDVAAIGDVTSNGGAHRLSSKKNFDISHPNKPGWRLRHTCLEGPENAVYIRGRLTNKNTIDLPDYWRGFVDPESITVSLTQIGSSQDLIVDKIEWGSKVHIRSGSSLNIDCYYVIHGTRIDGEDLIVEYQGESPADYPGDNSEYSVSGYHYDRKKK